MALTIDNVTTEINNKCQETIMDDRILVYTP